MVNLEAAYAACARVCRTHYENFPVASILLPRRMRPHVAAVYAFARAADDIADEGERVVLDLELVGEPADAVRPEGEADEGQGQ